MNSQLNKITLVLSSILLLVLLGAGPVQAATQVETVGNPTFTLPVAKWVDGISFPTPDVKIRVHYDQCPGGGDPLACAGALNNGVYDITFNPNRLSEFDPEFMRDVTYHEVGHVVSAAYFGKQTERDFVRRLGYPADREWSGDLDVGTPAQPTIIEPAEWFAEAYAVCVWGGDRPEGFASYGFNLTYRQVLPLCQQISLQMSGKPVKVPPAPVAPVLCSTSCKTRLGANDRFTATEQLVPGTVSAVVKYGKKAAMLTTGCEGKVKIGGDTVYLNFCSGILRVTTFSYKKVKVLWWGQTPPLTEPAAMPTVDNPHSTFTIEPGTSGPFPIDQWISSSRIVTPNITGRIIYAHCPATTQPACTSNWSGSSNYIYLDTQFLGQPGKDSEYYRALFYRSLGALITREYLGPEQQDTFKTLLGFPKSAEWGAYDASIPPTTSTPAKWFAEAYSTCAWGGDRPAATVSFGFNRSYASLKSVCDRIIGLIDGPKLAVPPIVQPPAPGCGSFCSKTLARKVLWTTSLPSPAALAIVKLGNKFAALPSGCSGTVRIGRAAVRLNYCGSTLRAKSVGRGRPTLRYFF